MQRRGFVSCRRPGVPLGVRTGGDQPPMLGPRHGETYSVLDDLLMIDAPLAPSSGTYPRLVVNRDPSRR